VTCQYPFVSDTPLTLFGTYFSCLDTQIGKLNSECYDSAQKYRFNHSHLHQSLVGVVCSVTFGNHIRSWAYGITLVHLHVFHLNGALFLVIWNFIYIVRVKMATGNSAKQQWATLNKHFLSNTSLLVDFYCTYMFMCRQVKYNRLKLNDNLGSSENLLGKCISNLLARGQLNWKIFFWVKWAKRPPKLMKQNQRLNTLHWLQICLCWYSNSGGRSRLVIFCPTRYQLDDGYIQKIIYIQWLL